MEATQGMTTRTEPPLRAGASAALFALALGACGGGAVQGYEIVAEYPHDPAAYTQGLLWSEGQLYESTGQNGFSSVRRVDLATGEVLARFDLPEEMFGEGLARLGDRLYQLTWTEGVMLVYDAQTLTFQEQIRYDGEGWGLTTDGTHLIQSDGSDLLRFRDPATFEEVRRVRVSAGGKRVLQLNELEWIDGEIWSNMWKSDLIARIDPATGEVRGWIDLGGLFDATGIPDEDAVLNGIAHDPLTGRLFVTGKLWPVLFEIRLTD